MFITIEQIKAARALLRWTQKDLAAHAGINDDQVHNFEGGRSRSLDVLEAIYQTFISNGIEFTDGDGVRKQKEGIKILNGKSGFIDFYNEVLKVAETKGGEFCVSNVDESLFDFWLGTHLDKYVDKIMALKNIFFKVLIKEGDYNCAASDYAQYRWVPEKFFSNVPFYIYGDKMAFILFKGHEDVSVYVIEQKDIVDAQRTQFNINWDVATEIPKVTSK